MRADLLKRLHRLETAMNQARESMTVFILEDGTQFLTDADPISYLIQNGTQTPRGKIVRYEHGEERDADPITRSIFECIEELICGRAP